MSAVDSRRSFLRGLTSLPLIGGGVALIGQPTAVAGEPSKSDLVAYATWLECELRVLKWELSKVFGVPPESMANTVFSPNNYHFPPSPSWVDLPMPSTRAALVLAAVDAKPGPMGKVSRADLAASSIGIGG